MQIKKYKKKLSKDKKKYYHVFWFKGCQNWCIETFLVGSICSFLNSRLVWLWNFFVLGWPTKYFFFILLKSMKLQLELSCENLLQIPQLPLIQSAWSLCYLLKSMNSLHSAWLLCYLLKSMNSLLESCYVMCVCVEAGCRRTI